MATLAEWETVAANMFASFAGQVANVTYKRSNPTTYDPATGIVGGSAGSETVDMFIKSRQDVFGESGPSPHELIGLARASVFRAAAIAEPLSTADKIAYGGVDHSITKIERIPETDSPVLYRFTFTAAGR